MRSSQDIMLGLTLILYGVILVGTARSLRPVGYLMGLSGVAYLAQGWVLATQGFSSTETLTIIISEFLILIWTIWLLVGASRIKEPVTAARSG